MSDREEIPPPMDAGLRALLRKTTDAFDAEASAHAGVALERLTRALPGVVPPGGGGGGGGAGAAAQGALAKLALPVVVSLILGTGIGAAVTHALEPARERIVYVDRPAPSVARVVDAVPAPVSEDAGVTLRVEDLPVVASAPAAAATASSSPAERLAAERLLLDAARAAFASGDHEKALSLLRRHGERFPGGVLAEERDALMVRALAALGRTSEAGARGRAFVTKYPGSIMRPAVESAASAAP